MRHHFLDHYWVLESPIHKLDPRIKIIAAFLALVAVVITPNGRFLDHIFFIPLLIALLYIARLPLGSILRRMAVILPLAIIIAASLPFISPGRPIITFEFFIPLTITDTGLANFASVVIKAVSAIWIMTLLTATTRFRDLVAGMQKLKLPTIFTSILGFMYRYIFLFIDEAEHLSIGRHSRSFGHRPLLAMKGFGWMLSSLFIRSFERGERIYEAMCARGFQGTFATLTEMKIGATDVVLCTGFMAIIITIKLIGHLYG